MMKISVVIRNCHLANGKAFMMPANVTQGEVIIFEDLGYNESPEHTDIIATRDREVTAILKDGSKRVIYRGGEFTF
jgi:aminopeptidase